MFWTHKFAVGLIDIGNSVSQARLAIDRPICILTRPVVITGFNRSLLVDWSIEKNMVDMEILSISYPNLLNFINRLKIVSI